MGTTQGTAFSPRDFLRARRPERFSDTNRTSRQVLDRAVLEFHLDTLTSRSEETAFEDFARKIAQREIAPNLLPHTGPTGGGDSKVDTETYPVSEAISETWYVASVGASGSERWAFAFSAKRDWRAKLRSDVASIASTKRGYKKVFFISNQAIPDKKRASLETELKKKHRFDVRVLDRNWLLNKVFEGHQEELAIEALRIQVTRGEDVQKGPMDLERERELQEVEARIHEHAEDRLHLRFVEDSLRAAILARSLELSRTEIDGRFLRADRAAQKHGTNHQRLRVLYEHAWTTFWWFEDYQEFSKLYDAVVELAQGTSNATDLELVTNLWTLASAAVRHGHVSAESVRLSERMTALLASLDALVKEKSRPSVALSARAHRARVNLMSSFAAPDAALKEFRAIVRESAGLIGFPIEQLSDALTDLSEFFVDNKAYDELFESLVTTTARRQGELAAARLLLKRGAEQLDAGNPYESIGTLGRALTRLYKHESRREMVRALYLCGAAYERVGLLWAARGILLHAASIATNEWWSHSKVTSLQAACYNRLKWVELQLGRVPHVLAWHELDRTMRSALVSKGYSREQMEEGEKDFDGIFGILLLRLDLWQLKAVERLPDVLDQLDLLASSIALRYALGHVEDFPSDLLAAGTTPDELIARWASQPASEQLLEPSLENMQKLQLGSRIIGCEVRIAAEHKAPCVEVSESVLACLEALLSTSILHGIMPRAPRLEISARLALLAESPFSYEFKEIGGRPTVEIRCAPPSAGDDSGPEQLKSKVVEVVIETVGRAFFIRGEEELDRVFVEEKGLDRAGHFSVSVGPITNILGANPKIHIEDWTSANGSRVELTRREEWDADARRARRAPAPVVARTEPEPASDEPPPGTFDRSKIRHTDIRFESVIRDGLWNRARWRGIGYLTSPPGVVGVPPWMVLGFEEREPAREIIEQLVRELGRDDPANRLRVSIVRKVSRQHPHHYRVLIGSNVDLNDPGKVAAVMTRLHLMEPTTSENLNRFLADFALTGSYYIAVAGGVTSEATGASFVPLRNGVIFKRTLLVREAWQIGPNDPDMIGISRSDDVPIPEEHATDAPVLQLLKRRADASIEEDD